MAFNPFQWFRKRQKVFLAALAIFCMFLFVLQFGQGYDVFDRLLVWLGGGRSQQDKTEVTQLYGKTITLGDLHELQAQREYAQAFLFAALDQGQAALEQELNSPAAKLEEPFGRQMQEILFRRLIRRVAPSANDAARTQIFTDLRQLMTIHDAMVSRDKTATAKTVLQLARALETELWLRSGRADSYFGGNFDTDGLLDFLVWRHMADKLAIHLTEADVRAALNREAMTEVLVGDPARDEEKVRELFRQRYTQVHLRDITKALTDEFRVRLAHEALTGVASGARAFHGPGLAGNDTPGTLTPDEFWNMYRENRTELQVVMLTVPVRNFLAKVDATPSEEELRRLFDQYRDSEPRPQRDRPAFKEPRRVKVEWASANPDAPFYQKKAPELVRDMDATTRFLAGATPAINLTGPIPACLHLALPLVRDVRMEWEYELYLSGLKNWWPGRDNPLYARGMNAPEGVATAVAQTMAASAGAGSPLNILAAVQGASAGPDRDQAARITSLVMSGTMPTVLETLTQQVAFAYHPSRPLAAIREELAERARQRLLPDFANGIMQNFQKELSNRRGNPREAAEWVAKNAVPEQGITRHVAMTNPRGEYDIVNDPALARLRELFRPLGLPMMRSDTQRFTELFFNQRQVYSPQIFPVLEETIYFWLTEDLKARAPTAEQFEEIRPKIVEAWKFDQARKLARKEADGLVEAVKGRKEVSGERFLRDEALRRGYEVFDPPLGIARLVRRALPFAMPGGGDAEYQPFQFPETQIAYPRSDTVDQLMKLKEPGDAIVVSDEPQKHFYVTVLIKREEPSYEKFYDIYEKSARGSRTLTRELLWARLENERQASYRTDLLKQLRAEAVGVDREGRSKLDDRGNYRIDPEVRSKIDRRERGGSEE
jgi:hypothetical protein